jgi:hypothetical protein
VSMSLSGDSQTSPRCESARSKSKPRTVQAAPQPAGGMSPMVTNPAYASVEMKVTVSKRAAEVGGNGRDRGITCLGASGRLR